MKQFSIHKVNKPMMRHKSGGADEEVAAEKMMGSGADFETEGAAGMSVTGFEQPSLLTAEEQEALQPKEIKVVNPWIHEATHKEYLESVKVRTVFN